MAPSLRRSRRVQHDLSSEAHADSSTPVHTRSVKVATDLTGSQYAELQDEHIDIKTVQTHFYNSFSQDDFPKKAVKVYGKAKHPSHVNTGVFKVGDTVLIDNSSRDPSIAVVTGIWKVKHEDKEICLNVSVHWFVRPSELPAIRADRRHEEAEIYYTLANNDILPAACIIGHCTIDSERPLIPDATTQHYCCFYAVNISKGFYYDFRWVDHHHEAVKASRFWDSPQHWDVTALNPPDTPQKPVVAGPSRRGRGTLPGIIEEKFEGDNSDIESPSKRKRKRTVRGSVSPAKRVRQQINHSDRAISAIPAPEFGLRKGTTPSPATPSRRGRERAASRASRVATAETSEESDGGSDFIARSAQSDSASEKEGGVDEVAEDNLSTNEDADDFVPRTPSRRKRGSTVSTPRKGRATLAAPTPHSKAALRARAKKRTLAVRPPPLDGVEDVALQLEKLPQDPWLRAMHVLHVASRPEAHKLPSREEEYAKVLQAVEKLLEEGSGGCIYISGVPGTGKTATVHAVVRELKRMAEQNEASPFTYVEINGLRIPEPSTAYNLLWEAVSGHNVARDGHLKISAKESLRQLSKHFGQGERFGPSGHACIVLMDELDQLMTTKQDVVYNFFNWPTLMGSKLVVLAVANTMDLPERVMTGRVRSRLGMVRINFQPYTTPQLEQIIKTRLQHARKGLLPSSLDVMAPDSIKFAAMKVSSISGDARRVLDICRRAVELVQPQARAVRTDDVKRVIVDMQNSPTAAYLRELSFHERLMLAALLRCVRREGVEEIKWGDVQRQHLLHINVLAEEEDTTRIPSAGELAMVLDSLVASRAILCEEGAIVSRKAEEEKRLVLNLEHTEVERVLGEVGGTKWKNALNI